MYCFDELHNRMHSHSSKWDIEEGGISMNVADMDFKSAPCIQDAIQKRMEQGIYGYQEVDPRYYKSFQSWWKEHHYVDLNPSWMIYSSGVVASVASIIKKFSKQQDQIAMLSPIYHCFYHVIENNQRKVITSDLKYENEQYSIDFDDLETVLKQENTTMMIVCNPHNPTGNVWDKETLQRIGDLCVKYHVLIISDEVHGDITFNKGYIPFLSASPNCAMQSITCLSVGKTFNLAGLRSACVVVPNEDLRDKVYGALNNDEIIEPNSFACCAVIAALQEGNTWYEQLMMYLEENRRIAYNFIHTHLPLLNAVKMDATYLLWIDCSKAFLDTDAFCKYLKTKKGLYISEGSAFGKNAKSFVRINIACPKEIMLEGLNRFKEGFDECFGKEKVSKHD